MIIYEGVYIVIFFYADTRMCIFRPFNLTAFKYTFVDDVTNDLLLRVHITKGVTFQYCVLGNQGLHLISNIICIFDSLFYNYLFVILNQFVILAQIVLSK